MPDADFLTLEQAISRIDWYVTAGVRQVTLAELLGIHDAHISRARNGDVTPTFERALRDRGIIAPNPPRYRKHYEAGADAGRIQALEADIQAVHAANLTEFVDYCRGALRYYGVLPKE